MAQIDGNGDPNTMLCCFENRTIFSTFFMEKLEIPIDFNANDTIFQSQNWQTFYLGAYYNFSMYG